MKTIIAIDPGASGGIAIRTPMDNVYAMPMPETRGDVINFLKHHVGDHAKDCVAYHEKINGYIPDGGPSMMFQFGANCERVGCILETLGVRIIEITPQAWQKDLALGKKDLVRVPSAPKELKGADKKEWNAENADAIKAAKAHNAKAKTDWKNKLKSESQRRFPNVGATLKTCDALLILDYAVRHESRPSTWDLFA